MRSSIGSAPGAGGRMVEGRLLFGGSVGGCSTRSKLSLGERGTSRGVARRPGGVELRRARAFGRRAVPDGDVVIRVRRGGGGIMLTKDCCGSSRSVTRSIS